MTKKRPTAERTQDFADLQRPKAVPLAAPTATSAPLSQQLEELGSLQFTRAEAALIVGLPDLEGDVHTSFLRGQLKAEAEVRRAIFTLAKQGSSPAQKEFLGLVERRRKREDENT
ncbi:MAG: hypothetical protein HY791_10370 [Deltaproteobacteria bacterium]|nr:hypothetical protein [Deltaproteobacteria bacterium]